MKKALSMLLTFCILASSIAHSALVVNAIDNPTILVRSGLVQQGTDIDVPIEIQNNPGIVAMLLKIHYDSTILTLTGATNGEVFQDETAVFGKDYANSPYTVLWEDSLAAQNNVSNGVMITLHFHVAEGIEGDAEIEVAYDPFSTFNWDLNYVHFGTQSAVFTIVEEIPPEPKISLEGPISAYFGEKIDVVLSLEDNPGLSKAKIQLEYDTALLELLEVKNGTVFDDGATSFENNLASVPYTLQWDTAGENVSESGVLAQMVFRVRPGSDDQECAIYVHLCSEDTGNAKGETMDIPTSPMVMTIQAANPPVLEALNGAFVDEENGFIYGLSVAPTEEKMGQYISVVGNGHVEYRMLSYIGTNTKAVLYNDLTGEIEKEYSIIIFGDGNGDGVINQTDIIYARSIIAGSMVYSENDPTFIALDTNRDGIITATDVVWLRSSIAGLLEIPQGA